MTDDVAQSRHSTDLNDPHTNALIVRTYRVQIAPRPIVIDEIGLPVEDAVIIEIAFPGETMETPTGPSNVIVGAGIAKITVAGETIRGVLLC